MFEFGTHHRPISSFHSASSSECLSIPDQKIYHPQNAFHATSKPLAYNVQVIQLVEGPPPPRRISSVVESSVASSSYASSSCSESLTEESESFCSSYCSSDDQRDESLDDSGSDEGISGKMSEDYDSLQNKRIQSWRDGFLASLSKSPAPLLDSTNSTSSTLKRKLHHTDAEADDILLSSSKRSRSHASELPCPACDKSFPTKHSLYQHGVHSQASEACRAAVSYVLE
jgi:hypothetical protein